jgi:hypothetical protein
MPNQIIFSGGTGRSGTTIIGKLLGQHSLIRVSRPIEIKFLAGNAGLLDLTYGRRDFVEMKKRKSLVYRILSNSKSISRFELERKFRERLLDDWWQREEIAGKGPGLESGVSVETRDQALAAFMLGRHKDPEGAAILFFETMVTAQNNNRGEPVWIDTSPPNIFNADRISRLFPQAKFIHMKRDGRNTIASVLREHWGPTDPIKAIFWWKNRIISSHQALQRVPRKNVIEIHLEEFAHFDRENQYQRLLTFLEIEDEPGIRSYFEGKVEGDRVMAQKWRDEIAHPEFESKFERAYRELVAAGIETVRYE